MLIDTKLKKLKKHIYQFFNAHVTYLKLHPILVQT